MKEMLRIAIPRDLSRTPKRLRTQMLAIRRFQYHYAYFLTSVGVVMAVMVGGLTMYLLNHNYHLLIRAELLTAPKLVDNLLRELKLANEFVFGGFAAFVGVMAIIGVRFSRSMIVPIYLIQEKMRGVSRGEMATANIRIRRSDEFQEFAETYNYMIDTLRMQTHWDIEKLKQLKPDDHNRDAVHLWETMIAEKSAQLSAPNSQAPAQAQNGGDSSDESASPDPTAFSYHAS